MLKEDFLYDLLINPTIVLKFGKSKNRLIIILLTEFQMDK